jgi:hypothetical protein
LPKSLLVVPLIGLVNRCALLRYRRLYTIQVSRPRIASAFTA